MVKIISSFNCGIGDEQTHIAEGLAFSLEVFKEFEIRRKQKYSPFYINYFNNNKLKF